jgi:hypothetical protein
VVSPIESVDGLFVIDATPIISSAIASPNPAIVLDEPVASATTSDGAKISGGVVSISVTT